MTDMMTIPTANLFFNHVQLEEIATTDNPLTGNGNVDVLGTNLAISGCRSLSQSFG